MTYGFPWYCEDLLINVAAMLYSLIHYRSIYVYVAIKAIQWLQVGLGDWSVSEVWCVWVIVWPHSGENSDLLTTNRAFYSYNKALFLVKERCNVLIEQTLWAIKSCPRDFRPSKADDFMILKAHFPLIRPCEVL